MPPTSPPPGRGSCCRPTRSPPTRWPTGPEVCWPLLDTPRGPAPHAAGDRSDARAQRDRPGVARAHRQPMTAAACGRSDRLVPGGRGGHPPISRLTDLAGQYS
jgi:hypothetical protein